MNIKEIREAVEEQIDLVRQDERELRRKFPTSYGHAYTKGCLDTLISIRNLINGDPDPWL